MKGKKGINLFKTLQGSMHTKTPPFQYYDAPEDIPHSTRSHPPPFTVHTNCCNVASGKLPDTQKRMSFLKKGLPSYCHKESIHKNP